MDPPEILGLFSLNPITDLIMLRIPLFSEEMILVIDAFFTIYKNSDSWRKILFSFFYFFALAFSTFSTTAGVDSGWEANNASRLAIIRCWRRSRAARALTRWASAWSLIANKFWFHLKSMSYASNLERACSALALWIYSIKTRLFLNTLPLALA